MKKQLFVVAAGIVISSQLAAQDSSRTLNPVVVTATKFLTKQSETGKVISVISREQLQRSAGKSLTEVLNQQAGITINGANNTPGTNQQLYLQGAASGNTLILVDGIPQNDASGISSEFDLNAFALDQIDRVEILKGAQSTLYGSDALAGVINIITKKSAPGMQTQATLSAGSFDTYKGSASISGSDENLLNYFVGYSHLRSGGLSAAYDSTGKAGFDNDGFDQDAFTGNLGFLIAPKLTARVNAKLNLQRNDVDAGAFADDKDYFVRNTNFSYGASLQYQLKNGQVLFNYNKNWVNRYYFDGKRSIGGFSDTQEGRYSSNTHFAELYTHLELSKHWKLLAGADFRGQSSDQRYASTSIYGPYNSLPLSADTTRTNQFSGYASLLYGNDRLNAELGGRFNHHSLYGSSATYSFNPSYRVGKNTKLFVNVSSGYKVPSLYQLFSEYGNRNLQPEQSINIQAGLQYGNDKVNVRLLGFKRDVSDVIIFYTDANFISFYKNEDKQEDFGGEAEFTVRFTDKLTLVANYSYVDGEIQSKTDLGKDTSINNLYRRPKHSINATLGYQFSKALYASVHTRNVSDFTEPQYAGAPYTMNGYTLVDVYAEYQLAKRFKLFVDLQNITDQRYFDLRGFNSKPFNFNGGITIQL